jgi:hypothetical protein
MIREKKEMPELLNPQRISKLSDKTFQIVDVKNVNTKFGMRPVIDLKQENKTFSVFLNLKSENNLIDCFGKDDEFWKGKQVILSLYTDDKYGKACIFVDKERHEEQKVV